MLLVTTVQTQSLAHSHLVEVVVELDKVELLLQEVQEEVGLTTQLVLQELQDKETQEVQVIQAVMLLEEVEVVQEKPGTLMELDMEEMD